MIFPWFYGLIVCLKRYTFQKLLLSFYTFHNQKLPFLRAFLGPFYGKIKVFWFISCPRSGLFTLKIAPILIFSMGFILSFCPQNSCTDDTHGSKGRRSQYAGLFCFAGATALHQIFSIHACTSAKNLHRWYPSATAWWMLRDKGMVMWPSAPSANLPQVITGAR